MAHIGLPEGLPGMRGLLAFRPEVAAPLGALTDLLLHQPHSLSPGEREMIAGLVSRQNDCTYCYRSHAAIAACHVGDAALVDAVMANPEAAPISDKMKGLLALAGRVREGGTAVRAEDIARARDAGATDLEIHDTVLIAALFCLCNRYVDGLATWTPDDQQGYRDRAAAVAAHGYSSVLRDVAPSALGHEP